MPTEVTLPSLGESVTEGTITRWLKQVGDTVAADEPLLEVSTDKVDTEIPSPVAGTLLAISADEDSTVEVGSVLATIGATLGDGGAAPSNDSAPSAIESSLEEPPAPTTGSAVPALAATGQPSTQDGVAVTLPALGESVTEGTITRWLKRVGDAVVADEPLLEVSTDKVDTEIPSPVTGTVLAILVEEDHTAEIGAQIATIGSGAPVSAAPTPPPPAANTAPIAPPAAPPTPPPSANSPEPVAQWASAAVAPPPREDAAPSRPATPPASQPMNTSPTRAEPRGGQPTAPQSGASPSPRGTTVPMTRLRRIIAERMVESLQISAQLTSVLEVDLTPVARLRDIHKAAFARREGVKLTFLPFMAKAALDALKENPSLNAVVDMERNEITYHDHENLAIAVDTDRGLLTPVIERAGELSVAGLARKIADVAERTRTNKIKPDEVSGGTFTITNTGSVGALFDTPIINQPQVAILGTGAVVKRPVVIDDADLGETIAVRHMAFLSVTYDHRVVDGADAARYLSNVKRRLESGAFEL